MTYLFFVYAVDIQTDVHINVLFLNLFYVKITIFNKDKMLEKVLKIKDFYPLLRCSNTTHSTCCICGTQKVWVNLLRINSVSLTNLHTRRVVIFCFHTNKQKAMKIILKWYCGTERLSPLPKETTSITPLKITIDNSLTLII